MYMERKMTYIERIHNVKTGEIIDQEYTKDQIKEVEATIESDLKIKAKLEAKETQRQAILDRLGLTADEAKLILG